MMDAATLAHLQIAQRRMPLDDRDRRAVIAWLHQVAGELEAGENYEVSIFTLGAVPASRE